MKFIAYMCRQQEESNLNIKTLAIIAVSAVGLLSTSVSAQEMKTLTPAMAKAKIVGGTNIPVSLTGKPGDPVNGKKIAINRKKGNCLACHNLPIADQPFHGNAGPELHGIGSRYTAAEFRLRLVNPKVINPNTFMPAFYRDYDFERVLKKFQGKTILSAQEVEDVIAYLVSIK